jgi:hypothetical protein
MRLKSSIWVAAYLRRCQTEGIFGAVRRRGAEEAAPLSFRLSKQKQSVQPKAPDLRLK